MASTSAPSTPGTPMSKSAPASKTGTPANDQYHQPKLTAILTPKTGKLAVTKDTNVDYEMKGGKIVYRIKSKTPIRRSPRKHMSPMKASYFNGEKPKPPKSRRSGGKLFSPAANYMLPDTMSPEKCVPSPVKFHTMSTDDVST